MKIEEFRAKVTDLVNGPKEVTDEEFWDRVGDWMLDVLAVRARAKRPVRSDG